MIDIVIRPDAHYVWSDPRTRKALSWYYNVLSNRLPAKFLIAKTVPIEEDFPSLSLDELWELHSKVKKVFDKTLYSVKNRKTPPEELEFVSPSFLDLKINIVNKLVDPCILCERKCKAHRRSTNKNALCRLGMETYVSTAFLHYGEEAPLVPSGTIFYSGCNFRCVFCQNYDISQEYPYTGSIVTPKELARIQRELRVRGARNINHVGGDPTPNLHTIIESLKYLDINVPQIWNSNFYMSNETMSILIDIIDLWLPDFKYWNNKCAIKLSGVPRYREVITRNLKQAVYNGDMIIRHLVLPNHIDCCSLPIIKWISQELPRDKVIVNIMDQYYPTYRVTREPDRWREINRRIQKEEIETVYSIAKEKGLLYDIV